jgi:hypothetical protein
MLHVYLHVSGHKTDDKYGCNLVWVIYARSLHADYILFDISELEVQMRIDVNQIMILKVILKI